MSNQDSDFFLQFEKKKEKLRVLVLGAYSPPEFEDRLEEIKNNLIAKGYRNTKLVKDFPDNPPLHADRAAHIIAKSQHYIKFWANVIIFVFSNGAANEGVSIELEFCCLKVIEKLNFSLVFIENGLHSSSLIMGSIKLHEIRSETYPDIQELCEKASGYLTSFVHRLYWYL